MARTSTFVSTPQFYKDREEEQKRKFRIRPRIAVMVHTAIKYMNERNGSSLRAIKKYMESIYRVNIQKSGTLIKKSVKNGVASGVLIQITGTGANGSFKIAGICEIGNGKKAKKRVAKRKTAKPKIVAKPKTKKVVKPPKKVSTKKNTVKTESTAKSKKSNKVLIKKSKSPKRKTTKKTKVAPRKK